VEIPRFLYAERFNGRYNFIEKPVRRCVRLSLVFKKKTFLNVEHDRKTTVHAGKHRNTPGISAKLISRSPNVSCVPRVQRPFRPTYRVGYAAGGNSAITSIDNN